MPYIFRVIKVEPKKKEAAAPQRQRLNMDWKNDKQKQIFEAVEDCILDTANRLKAGEPVNADGLQVLFDGVRIIHHMRNMDREAAQDMIQILNKAEVDA